MNKYIFSFSLLFTSGAFAMIPETLASNSLEIEALKNKIESFKKANDALGIALGKRNHSAEILKNTNEILSNKYKSQLDAHLMTRQLVGTCGSLIAGAIVGLCCNKYLKRSQLFSSEVGIATTVFLGIATTVFFGGLSDYYLSNWYKNNQL